MKIVYAGLQDPKHPEDKSKRVPIFDRFGKETLSLGRRGVKLEFGKMVDTTSDIANKFMEQRFYDDGDLRAKLATDPLKYANYRPPMAKYVFAADDVAIQPFLQGILVEQEAKELEIMQAKLKAMEERKVAREAQAVAKLAAKAAEQRAAQSGQKGAR